MLIDQVEDLYLQGTSIASISRKVDRSYITIIRYLHKLGIYKNSKNTFNNNFFQDIDEEIKAYWFGFIQADGCIKETGTSYMLKIELSNTDKKHLEKFAKLFNRFLSPNKSKALLEINSKKIYKDLQNNGIEERKSYSENIEFLNHIPYNLINHFVRGIFDGDGSIYCQNNNKRMSYFSLCGTYEMLFEIQKIIEKEIQKLSKVEINFNSGTFNLTYGSHNNLISIYNWLYKDATIWLERKRNKFEEIIKELTPKDREKSPYKGVRNQNKYITAYININSKTKHIKCCKTELEAAYWHDLEQVKFRGKDALYHMNFPEQINQFHTWIQEGY